MKRADLGAVKQQLESLLIRCLLILVVLAAGCRRHADAALQAQPIGGLLGTFESCGDRVCSYFDVQPGGKFIVWGGGELYRTYGWGTWTIELDGCLLLYAHLQQPAYPLPPYTSEEMKEFGKPTKWYNRDGYTAHIFRSGRIAKFKRIAPENAENGPQMRKIAP